MEDGVVIPSAITQQHRVCRGADITFHQGNLCLQHHDVALMALERMKQLVLRGVVGGIEEGRQVRLILTANIQFSAQLREFNRGYINQARRRGVIALRFMTPQVRAFGDTARLGLTVFEVMQRRLQQSLRGRAGDFLGEVIKRGLGNDVVVDIALDAETREQRSGQ